MVDLDSTTTPTYEALHAQAESIGLYLYVEGLHTPKPRYSLHDGDRHHGGELLVETTDLAVINDRIASWLALRNGHPSRDTQPSAPGQTNGAAPSDEPSDDKDLDARRDAERDVLDIKDFKVTGDVEADPDELMEMANKLYDETVNTQFDAAWHIGELLWRAKKQKAHGEYLPWVAEHFHGTRQTAAIYVKIYEEGDSPANVTTSLHLERPSISAAVKAIATRKAESKPTPSKRDAAAKKRKTVRDTAMRKVKAASEYIRTEAVKALGTLTATEAVEYASELEGYLSVIDQFYDQVNGMGTAKEPSKS
jgi:hypothetical protein